MVSLAESDMSHVGEASHKCEGRNGDTSDVIVARTKSMKSVVLKLPVAFLCN